MMSFSHNPGSWIAVWCLVSLLSGWYDMLYVCLRPHSLPSSRWHDPFSNPMAQWAALDNLYGAISCFETLGGRRIPDRFAPQIALFGLLAFVVQATKQIFYSRSECDYLLKTSTSIPLLVLSGLSSGMPAVQYIF
ncbi:hypothetical protein BKA58DRAFT_185053 [Alternaria rosae]|uniref:uncharacterized protein n=1 Tax=Alternaria rosae TaxID=1187941 RepID=UPI001E8E1193|nr:uncharacterized protein BKA58DRAFT_185053 [Alternaria rosae]KAH6870836.1 hypothetical protein BKA58DRAFT_185053 [Alternaria rosae]